MIVRYRVKADEVAQNVRLVRAVYDELAKARPRGLRYSTYRSDERTFVHVAVIEGPGNPLDDVSAFRTFTAGIGERCDELPQVTDAELVGSYPD